MKKYALAIFTLAVLFSSCISTNYIAIDIREPALVSFPFDVVNIAVVDNSQTKERDEDYTLPMEMDSIAAYFGEALSQFMDEEQFFGSVARESIDRKGFPLTEERIRDICNEKDVEAIITIDKFDLTGTQQRVHVDGPDLSLAVMTPSIKLRTFLYNGKELQPFILFNDTLQWVESFNRNKSQEALVEVIKEVAAIAADAITKQYIPHWQEQERWFYSDGSGGTKVAKKLFEQSRWKEAALAWGEAYENEEKPIKKARLAFNIALANEYLDDLENALTWIKIAEDLVPQAHQQKLATDIAAYQQILQKRMLYQTKLKIQLGNGQ